MLSNELGKFGKVALLLQDLVAELCLGHYAVEMRGDHALERADSQISTYKQDAAATGDLQCILVFFAASAEDFCQEHFNENHILEIALLGTHVLLSPVYVRFALSWTYVEP